MPSWRASLVACSCVCSLATFGMMFVVVIGRSDWSITNQARSGSSSANASVQLSLGLRYYRLRDETGKEESKKFVYAAECANLLKIDTTHCEQVRGLQGI